MATQNKFKDLHHESKEEIIISNVLDSFLPRAGKSKKMFKNSSSVNY